MRHIRCVRCVMCGVQLCKVWVYGVRSRVGGWSINIVFGFEYIRMGSYVGHVMCVVCWVCLLFVWCGRLGIRDCVMCVCVCVRCALYIDDVGQG